MLYLTRKVGESVIINDEIEVTVVDIRGKSIKLGFNFPPEASVLRREIHERIQEENRAAAGGAEAFAAAFGGTPAPTDTDASGRDRDGRDSDGRDSDGQDGEGQAGGGQAGAGHSRNADDGPGESER
jgi:carbon storage regulator